MSIKPIPSYYGKQSKNDKEYTRKYESLARRMSWIEFQFLKIAKRVEKLEARKEQ